MATTPSPSTANAANFSYANYYSRRLERSIRRHEAKQKSPALILAREFFDDTSSPLASRLTHLSQRLKELMDTDDHASTRSQLAAAIFARAPSTFTDECGFLFEEMLEHRQQLWQRKQDGEMEEGDKEMVQEALYGAISSLGWVSYQLRTSFLSSLSGVTQRVIKEVIESDFETEGLLSQCLSWKDDVLLPFVQSIVDSKSFINDRWNDRLQYATYESFIHQRSAELFDLVTEYPESLPAVRELSAALDGTGRILYTSLAVEWRKALEKRLIHSGAQTSQIIDVYISTIKVLQQIDSSGELLAVVTKPVREYLRGREDTIRCIITSLTEEETGGDLYAELRRMDAKPLEETFDEEDDEVMPTFDWMPPPSILKRRGVISGRVGKVRAGDILSMLVGIYGSKELFVNEYRVMLADKLLSNLEYDTDKEVHNVELLKLRFGEASMRQCEVMVKDIDDSKRIHANICSTLNATTMSSDNPTVDSAIISHVFWPSLQKEEFENHTRIQSQLDSFANEYAKLKNPRRLVWMKQLGHVELELEVYEKDKDGHIESHLKEVKCTPAHATLLAHFEDKTRWSVEDLAIETNMPEEIVRKRMGFWINQRVIRETQGSYVLISVHDAKSTENSFIDHDDDDHEHAVSYGADQEEEMQAYESYIVGMLSNLGQISLEKIHTMLKTFVAGSDHKYDKTPQQLAVFLQQLCKEDKLECSPDGLYKLLKKRS